jgi:hypothetical protein
LVLSGLSLFINDKESAILWKILHSNASKIEHTPPTILDILTPERFLEIWPREPGTENGAWEGCLEYRSGSDIHTGLLRVLQDKELRSGLNRCREFADAVWEYATTGSARLLLFNTGLGLVRIHGD